MDKLDVLKEFTERIVLQINDTEGEVLERLVDLRAEVIAELQARVPLSDADKNKVKSIQSHHDKLIARMEELRDEASEGLNRIQQSRVQKRSYESYVPANSFFFDKKK